MKRFVASLCLAAMTAGCATPPPPQLDAWLLSGRAAPPPQDACPAVAELDLPAVAREREARLARDGPRAPDAGFVVLPEAAEALIPADAVVVIRANLPPGGLYSNDLRSVVWKTADGVWRVWRQNKDYGAPSPQPPTPPPPPGPEGSPEYAAWAARYLGPQRVPTDDERWPPQTGLLPAETAARLEAALADPCRAWDPDYFPYDQPLRRRNEYGTDRQLCPPDGGYYAADITEPGRARRGIGANCINDTPTYTLISTTAYARPQS